MIPACPLLAEYAWRVEPLGVGAGLRRQILTHALRNRLLAGR